MMLMLFDELVELSQEADQNRLLEALQVFTSKRDTPTRRPIGFRRTGPLRKA